MWKPDPSEIKSFDRDRKDKALLALRAERNKRLAESDVAVQDALLSDGLTKEQKRAWREYKKALRDLPDTVDDPSKPSWPAIPGR